jgi:hypothetical protein
LRFALTSGSGDLSDFTVISLRAALDPLSPLNAADRPGPSPVNGVRF